MPVFTKKAIIDSFMRIAEKKPLQKITVRDIVDDCGINRNTFYYYFRDIYEVAEAVFSYPSEFPSAPVESAGDDPLLSFGRLLSFAAAHHELICNLYRSVGYEQVEKYLRSLLGRDLSESIRRSTGDALPAEDADMLDRFLQKAIFGVVIEWFVGGMKEDPAVLTEKLYELAGATIRTFAHTDPAAVRPPEHP